jgi:glycosidase
MIYYGDEVGMWGANDPCCRKPMLWEDLNYKDEVYLPDQTKRKTTDAVNVNKDIFNHYKKLIHIRNNSTALQLGDYKTLLIDDEKEILVFERNYEGQKNIIAINKSNVEQKVEIVKDEQNNFVDVLNRGKKLYTGSKLKFNLKPKWARIFATQI